MVKTTTTLSDIHVISKDYLNRGIRFPGFRLLMNRSRENMTAVSPESAYLRPYRGKLESEGG